MSFKISLIHYCRYSGLLDKFSLDFCIAVLSWYDVKSILHREWSELKLKSFKVNQVINNYYLYWELKWIHIEKRQITKCSPSPMQHLAASKVQDEMKFVSRGHSPQTRKHSHTSILSNRCTPAYRSALILGNVVFFLVLTWKMKYLAMRGDSPAGIVLSPWRNDTRAGDNC